MGVKINIPFCIFRVTSCIIKRFRMTRMRQANTQVMKIENPHVCQIIERLNRFVVLIESNEKFYRAHINNTGRLHDYLVKGRKAFCCRNENPGKTDFRLFAVEEGTQGALIDTQFQMRALEKSLKANHIHWLKGCSISKRNARLGASLIDYLLVDEEGLVYVEVKSAVLREAQYAMYPDCPSLRGQKHIREISSWIKKGGRGIIVFMAALPQVEAFKPNKVADPKIYELLVKAVRIGVEVKAISLYYNPQDSFIYLTNPDLEVDLS